jgi:hypothetical protein
MIQTLLHPDGISGPTMSPVITSDPNVLEGHTLSKKRVIRMMRTRSKFAFRMQSRKYQYRNLQW